jgi:4-aminobutyrate aminotransferase-like enzyme
MAARAPHSAEALFARYLDRGRGRAHHLRTMAEDKPSALDDVRKGLGLLFRAAKTTVEKLPTKDLEEVVVTSAREVGRAIENVGKTLEREVFGKKQGDGAASNKPGPSGSSEKDTADSPKPPDAT